MINVKRFAQACSMLLMTVVNAQVQAAGADGPDIQIECPCEVTRTEAGETSVTIGVRNTSSEAKDIVLDLYVHTGEHFRTGYFLAELVTVGTVPANSSLESASYSFDDIGPGAGDYYITVYMLEETISGEGPEYTYYDQIRMADTVELSAAYSVAGINLLTDTDSDGVGDFNEKLEGTDVNDPGSKPGVSTIDLLVVYDKTLEAEYGSESAAFERIDHIIATSNQSLIDSGVNMELRVVHKQLFDDESEVHVKISAIAAAEGIYSTIPELRDQYGGDLVTVLTAQPGQGCGIAYLGGSNREGHMSGSAVVNASSVVFDGCDDMTVLHEVGHNMGLGHSAEQGDTGTFNWSRGYGVVDDFYTVMAYFSAFSSDDWPVQMQVLSNPEVLSCNGQPCGRPIDGDEPANAAKTLEVVRFQVARFKPTVDLTDTDGDGTPDTTDTDDDNDGTPDTDDAFPLDNSEQLDSDSDGVGNNADLDDDGDGLSDEIELEIGYDPLNANDATGSSREIFWRHKEYGWNVLWSMEAQHRVERNSLNTVSDANWKVAGLADFTGDGLDEVFFRHEGNGSNRLWLIEGGQRTDSLGVVGADTAWQLAAMGDFDADGDADLIWRNKETGANRYWEMNRETRVRSVAVKAVSLDWQIVGAGDFDGDGIHDLLWRNTNGANVVWLMESEQIKGRASLNTVGSVWSVAAVGDFDGDGAEDIFWHAEETGDSSIWLLSGTQRKDRGSLPRVSAGWSPVAAMDMDADGKSDIIWRHTSGANRLWLMNGTERLSSLAVDAVTDPNWEPVAVGNVNH